MNVSAERPGWGIVGEPRYVQGYIHGFAHPCIIVDVRMAGPLPPAVADDIERQLIECFPRFERSHRICEDADGRLYGAARFLDWMEALRRLVFSPIDVPGRVYAVTPDVVGMLIPCEILARDTQKALIKALIALIDAAIREEPLSSPLSEIVDLHRQMFENCAYIANGLYFFLTGVTKGLPVRELSGGVLQFGIGSASRRMSGGLSEATSVIAMRLARDKRLAVQVLGQSGVPVPMHRTAETAEQAVAFAEQFGYPVVVKPADLDGGQGVAARLENAAEVAASFEQCRKLSSNVIVEKFIEGRDYRIDVLNDEAIFAVERVPGHVIGNGIDTVATLIDTLNADPLRSHGPKPPQGKLLLDDEAAALMRKRGIDAQTVLAKGDVLRLRSAANVASGGTPVNVFERAHPDNLAIAVRAAQALRLDIAGIDLITPDIARSWREAGGAICEVNASPDLGLITSTPAFSKILDATVPRGGRIPVVLIVGADDPEGLAKTVSDVFTLNGLRVGCHTPDGIRIDGAMVAQGNFMSVMAGHLLALDMNVDAMVLCLNDTSPATTGLPIDRYDVMLLAGQTVSGAGGLGTLLSCILPACAGAVIPVGDGDTVTAQTLPTGARWNSPVKSTDLPAALLAELHLVPA